MLKEVTKDMLIGEILQADATVAPNSYGVRYALHWLPGFSGRKSRGSSNGSRH